MDKLSIKIDEKATSVKINHITITFDTMEELRLYIKELTIQHLRNYGVWGE